MKVKVKRVTKGIRQVIEKPNAKAMKSGMSSLSRRQQYKLKKMGLKNQKYEIKTREGRIRQAGKAVAEGSAPIAGSISASRTAEQITAQRRMSADAALQAWNQNINGNPDTDKGQDGESQGESSTTNTSAGSFRSVIH